MQDKKRHLTELVGKKLTQVIDGDFTSDGYLLVFDDETYCHVRATTDGELAYVEQNPGEFGLCHYFSKEQMVSSGLATAEEYDEYVAQQKRDYEARQKARDYAEYLRLKARFEPDTVKEPGRSTEDPVA